MMRLITSTLLLDLLLFGAGTAGSDQESALSSDLWLRSYENKQTRTTAVSYVMGFFDASRGLARVACPNPISYESLASVTADVIRTQKDIELMLAVGTAQGRLGCRLPGQPR